MASRKSGHRDTNLLRGLNPKFLRNLAFAKKHKKGLKKVQANNAMAVSTHTEATKALVKPQAIKALVKPKPIKSKMPKDSSHKLGSLDFIA
jgi:large subunit ribosomal protein L29e